MTRRLLCAGEVVVDLVLTVPALPRRGGDVIASAVATEVGGAFNVMAAAARQGVPVTYAGLLGTGPMADRAAAALAAEGIEAPLAPRAGSDTGTVLTLVEPDGERTFVTTLGAEAQLTQQDLAAVPVRADDVVHCSGYGLAYPGNGPVLVAWLSALPRGVTVVFDPGPLVTDIAPSLLVPVLERCDWVSCDLTEARFLCSGRAGLGDADGRHGLHGADGPEAPALAGRLLDWVRGGAVVRLGRHGAVVATREVQARHVPAAVVDAVDLSGAGDAHVGSLIASLAVAAPDFDPVTAVRRANLAAAFAVTRHGPARAPTDLELQRFSARLDR